LERCILQELPVKKRTELPDRKLQGVCRLKGQDKHAEDHGRDSVFQVKNCPGIYLCTLQNRAHGEVIGRYQLRS
jgi:hypothetical protein